MPLALALLVASSAVVPVATAEAEAEGAACSREIRAEQLKNLQEEILALLRPWAGVDLTTIEGEADLAVLVALGYSFYPHQQTSVHGMGWPVLDTLNPGPAAGRPTLLLYAPSGEDVTAPRDGFDFPYELAGWAYVVEYQPWVRPSLLSCMGQADWFVHERVIHTFDDGGFTPIRPVGDEPRGAAEGDDIPCVTDLITNVFCTDRQPGDFGHPRAWDLHMWLDGDAMPTVSMNNPGQKIPGVDAQIGKAFFFPVASE